MSAIETHRIGLGLGANLGAPADNLRAAVVRLKAAGVRIDKVSSIYRTAPWGEKDQPDFANACALGATSLTPLKLLACVKSIETAMGRVETKRWGPRAIDIDLLFYEGVEMDGADLQLPHPQIFARAFVLRPLAEIAPNLILSGRSILAAARDVDASDVKSVELF